ncbi:sensor domain-containing diguanylate cyclase [Aestuariibacter sp. GS-14]|nr:sensor domain-containing diguanylate cyclase [Aestuariibacter sp. GS-14]
MLLADSVPARVLRHTALLLIWLLLWRLSVVMEYAPHASIWFPPVALTFTAIVFLGWRACITISLACVLSTFWEDYIFETHRNVQTLLTSGVLFAALHVGIYGAGAALLRTTLSNITSYNLYSVVMRFLIICAATTLLVSLLGTLVLYQGLQSPTLKETLIAWWIGDMSGMLVLTPIFIALLQRWYPARNFLAGIAFTPIVHANDFPYSIKLLLSMLGLVVTSCAAYYFNSPEIACFVFFLAMPQMWIVYTESPLHAAISLALLGFAMAGLVSLLGIATQAYIFQFALCVMACSTYFSMAVPALISDNRELHQQAHFDSLTKALTRHSFFNTAEQLAKQAVRYHESLSLIVFDIDKFKQINDTHGHTVGDAVLKSVASVARSVCRESDLFGRFGGDEFLILLPNTPLEAGVKVAEQIRNAVSHVSAQFEDIDVSCSFGVAPVKAVEGLDEAFELADRQLLAAKRAGRNQVKCSPF